MQGVPVIQVKHIDMVCETKDDRGSGLLRFLIDEVAQLSLEGGQGIGCGQWQRNGSRMVRIFADDCP
ncbi:hypothetical protein GCM10027190_04200 [Spirosoma areae]